MNLTAPTPHIAAQPGDFAPTVLLPGDPLRARMIAERFFDSPRLVNNVRGVQGYTGRYHGCPVSVMASGMGSPAMGIYSYELFHAFGVQTILRVGTCGGLAEGLRLRELVLAQGACTDSAYAAGFGLPGAFAPLADFALLRQAADAAAALHLPARVGNVVTSDRFYAEPGDDSAKKWRQMGVLAVEMETAALYMNAARAGRRALSILTVSDHLFTGEATPAEERETAFTDMVRLALSLLPGESA